MQTQHALTIGLFTDDFFGGIVRSLEVQATELAKQGYRVIIFAPHMPFDTLPTGCEFQPVKFWWHKKLAVYMGFLSWSKKTVHAICQTYNLDVVHSHNERGSMLLCARLAKQMNIPHVHTFHSNYAGTHMGNPFIAALNSMLYMPLIPKLLGHYSHIKNPPKTTLPAKSGVVEVSMFARHDWRTIAQMARYLDAFTSPASFVIDKVNECTSDALRTKGFFIANGINPAFAQDFKEHPKSDVVRFISCGRLDPEKRVDILIRAFAKLKNSKAQLIIIGVGSQRSAYQALVKHLGVTNKVTFLGQIDSREQMAKQYANADVFVFPSYHYDTQGLVLGEAASAGEAIIYCDERLRVGVNEQNSLLITPSAAAFTKAMRALMQDKARLHKMQQASLKLRPLLSPQVMATNMLNVYRSVLKK